MPSPPRLSITVLNYNYGRFIGGALESILNQTFKDIEVIVVDDASTDDSAERIRPFLDDSRVRLVRHEKNVGFPSALIEGTEVESSGKFRTLVSADDLALRRDAFELQIDLLTR